MDDSNTNYTSKLIYIFIYIIIDEAERNLN